MNLGQGWNVDGRQLLRLRILERLAVEPMSSVPNVLQYRSEDDPYSTDDYVQALQEFDSLGWLNNYQHSYGQLNAAGRNAPEQIDQVRQDRRERNRAVLDAILYWLEEQTANGQPNPAISQFTQSSYGLWFGEPFPTEEVSRATVRLKDEDYLRGSGSLGGGIIRPAITPKGQRLVESDRSVHDEHVAAGGSVTNTINQYGDYAIAQAAGHGATLHVANTITEDHRQQVLHLADAVEQAQASLSPEAAAEVEALRAAVAPGQSDPGIVRTALQSAKTTLSTGTGNILGKLILGAFGGLLAHYGIPLG